MTLLFYNLLFHLFFPFGLTYLIAKQKIKFEKIYERFGIYNVPNKKDTIWVHSASVGETKLASLLINKLRESLKEYRFVLSVNTDTARKIAEKEKYADLTVYAPFDSPLPVNLAIHRIKPKALIIIETEIWPNLISIAKHVGVKVFLVNGRFSDKKLKFYKMFKFMYEKIIHKFDLCLMRSQIDYENIKEICPSEKIILTGDMKYDFYSNYSVSDEIYQEFGFLKNDTIFTAGSIHAEEDEIIIQTYIKLLKTFPNLKLIIAPRYLNRVDYIQNRLTEYNIKCARKTKLHSNINCLILDTYGDLIKAYMISKVVFVGGSLIPVGGHNMFEPVTLGKPVIFGRYTFNFKELANILKSEGIGFEVKNEEEIIGMVSSILSNDKLLTEIYGKAKSLVDKLRGTAEKNRDYIVKSINQEIKRILLIQPGRIGDIIFSLPTLVSIKKLYPESKISWVVDTRYEELLKGNPYLNDVIKFPFKDIKHALRKLKLKKIVDLIIQLRRTLKDHEYDLSIDLHGLAKSAMISFLASAKYKLASSSTYGMRELSWLFSREIKPKQENLHCIDRHVSVVEYLGGRKKEEFPLITSSNDKKYVIDLLLNSGVKNMGNIFILFPGGGWKSRRWLIDRFAALADEVINIYNAEVVIIGGKPSGAEEGDIDKQIIRLTKNKIHNLTNLLNLKQLISLIQMSRIFIGNEAGPMHIACALGTPVVAILGPTDANRTGPFGKKYKIVQKNLHCNPCRKRNCKKLICMRSIEVKDVINAVNELLNANEKIFSVC